VHWRNSFGVDVARLHADTTSFSVHGRYAQSAAAVSVDSGLGAGREGGEDAEGSPAVIEVTYGYSRDHRDDLKQCMLAHFL
jgi:transposase